MSKKAKKGIDENRAYTYNNKKSEHYNKAVLEYKGEEANLYYQNNVFRKGIL